MQATIIKIGNSQGIRIPKPILELCHFDTKIELTVVENGLLITSPKLNPRAGWEEQFKQMHENGDDELLLPSFFKDENLDWWTW